MSTDITSSSHRDLKRDITRLVLLARGAESPKRPLEPRFVSYDSVMRPNGKLTARKKVILMTTGCSVPTCTMCPFTNENLYGRRVPIDLVGQVRAALSRTDEEPPYTMLALYNDGNFFAPREIPPDVQLTIADLVAKSGVQELVVESLPQFITRAQVEPFIKRLNGVNLEVGIGLQSAHAFVREICVNTSFSNAQFESAVALLKCLGASVKTYLMMKPPFLTEGEAIRDNLNSLEYLRHLTLHSATLCPTRVAKNTLAHKLFSQALYTPPNLWSIVEVIRRASADVQLRVACINLRGSDFESIFPDSCPECADAIVDGLEVFSLNGNTNALPSGCQCRPDIVHVPTELDSELLRERIEGMLPRLQ